ncbi:MAG: hemolysin III family protein [Deltaproteobacteria bacterium]|nr:hemolysin III family protein [Deltaproteobacteria bacterium]
MDQVVPLKFLVHLREPVSGLTSFLCGGLAIAGLVLMVIAGVQHGNAWHVVSFSVFGASLILLYFSSALYHLLPLQEKGAMILKRVDHMMIFVLIAGTYTPFCLVPLHGPFGWSLFGIIWSLCVVGICKKIFWLHAPRWISVGMYLGMGWLSVVFIYPLTKILPLEAMIWLALGGVMYTVGAIFYAIKWPNPFPKVFGFHEIWHFFIMAGSFSHFWTVYKYLPFI